MSKWSHILRQMEQMGDLDDLEDLSEEADLECFDINPRGSKGRIIRKLIKEDK